MARQPAQLGSPAWIDWLSRNSSLLVPIGFVALLGVIVVPLPPIALDVLIAANLSLSAVILLTTVYVGNALEFSVFPSLLLGTTLFRLVLNVASTRLILSADATTAAEATNVAGKVIAAFGSFVAGGSSVVGFIIFVILIVVQFVVITKGATRISEVAARFTLDGMPGKQMAIDADLNAGAIDENEARDRREFIAREADFYGAMDGASKFVRGDAIAGVIITVINIFGGFAVGVWEKGWTVSQALDVFTKLTIGDGLVTQLPSFVIAIAAGLIVTRASSRDDLGTEMTRQLTSKPVAMGITALFVGMLAFSGLPAMPMLLLAGGLGTMAIAKSRNAQHQADAVVSAEHAREREQQQTPTPVEKLLSVDMLELEVGYGLVRMVDQAQGGDLLDRINMIRRQLAVELGVILPPIRVRDNPQLSTYYYRIRIKGSEVATGTARPGQLMAMDSGLIDPNGPQLEGEKTREPAFGLDAWWIEPAQKQRAEALNYTVVDTTDVLATHLTEVIRTHADELLSREETNRLLDQLREKSPKLVEEVIPAQVKVGELQKVLQNLLRERVPIRDLETVLETLSDWAQRTKDLDVLTEYVRNALRRTICGQYIEVDPETQASRLYCVTLDPGLEDLINGYVERSEQGTTMTIPPHVANRITTAILQELQKVLTAGHHPVVLASPQVRGPVRQLLEPHLSNAAVLGYNEASKGVEVESMGLVQVDLGQSSESPSNSRLEGALN